MKFTDIFIRRPVLASVVSLLILLMGLAAIFKLQIRQYPKMDNTTITVTTAYPGANADLIQGFVTLPLEKSIGSAEGIDYMSATSSSGSSTITVHIKLNYDPDRALTQITGKVNAVLSQLPKGITSPTITKSTGNDMPDLILGFNSSRLTSEEVTAYLTNVMQPEINAVGGISQVQIMGAKNYAMRIWLNSQKMALLGITPSDVSSALAANNVQATPGKMKSQYVYTAISLSTDLKTAAQFNNLVVKNDHGRLIRIRDIGKAELGSDDYDSQVYFDGKKAVFVGVTVAPGQNPLTVIAHLLKKWPSFKAKFPTGLDGSVVYNSTSFIKTSIHEVIKTIAEAVIIVILVIFLFLGALRSVLIPVVTIPLSLIGVCFCMLLMGFSLNLLTLLAMVLAIGLVVDDAIVVLENIYRHIEEGLTPFQAAVKGAREIRGPVIVMTTTLVAVFAPIGFIGGLTGALFTEFAFTLAGAVIISGIIALTLSPMMCSKVVNRSMLDLPFVKKVDRTLEWIRDVYRARLSAVLQYRPAVLIVAAAILGSCYLLFTMTPSELVPTEDQGFVIAFGQAPSWANLNYLQKYSGQAQQVIDHFGKEMKNSFVIDGFPNSNTMLAGMVLKDWGDRHVSQMDLVPQVRSKMADDVDGMQVYATNPPSLPGISFGPGIQFVVTSTSSYESIHPVMQRLVEKASKSGLFMFVNSNLKFDTPQLTINIDRAKAAALGISMQDIASTLQSALSGGWVNYFNKNGYSFKVIPQLSQPLRSNPKALSHIHIKTQSGKLIPLSSLVTYQYETQPQSLVQFQQLNSATLEAMLMPGVPESQAIQYLQTTANNLLPNGMSYNYSGSTRQYIEQGNTMIYAFILAILVIFLVLAAQFESFRDPLIILVSVPMSIFGALIPLFLGAATINIYTEIGLITLIGLISKHGILMVEFANKRQEEGLSIHDAIVEAAAIRLRPILMTTAAMVFGVLPLIIASGAGAVSRHDVGLVIAAGMVIGTCFTLFVVPTIYTYLAKDRKKDLAKKAAIQMLTPELKKT